MALSVSPPLQEISKIHQIITRIFYSDNNVNYITLGDIDLLVQYFDSDRDGVLSYNE